MNRGEVRDLARVLRAQADILFHESHTIGAYDLLVKLSHIRSTELELRQLAGEEVL